MNAALRSKKLPPRPSQDLGYGIVNGSGAPPESYGFRNERNGDLPARTYGMTKVGGHSQDPSGRVMLDGYKTDIMNGFEGERQRNPMNTARPQSSMLLNLNDTVQVHLLVETALGDSKEYEILSQDEVDDLKKQVQTLSQRIETTRQNLAIQSKYRDAAISMSKLYSPGEKKKSYDGSGKIRNMLNRSSSEQSQEQKQERMATEKKCEDLAAELWFLEKRLIEPQHKLLKHTAGILQMTHKGPKVMGKGAPGAPQQGMPGSPESMYTYSNARSSLEFTPSDELIFDERSLYRSFDPLDGTADLDDLFGPPKGGNKQQMQMISKTEQKLEDLNRRLRDVITKANPERETNYQHPPSADGKPTEPGETLMSHLDYLEKGISTISNEHSKGTARQGDSEQMETVLRGLWEIILTGEGEARQRKQERRQQRSMNNLPPDDDDSPDEDGDLNEPFSIQGFSSKVQWLYSQASKLKDQKKVLQRQIKQQRELNSKSDASKDDELAQKDDELQRTQEILRRTDEQLNEAMEKQTRSNDDNSALQQLEDELQELKDDHSISIAELQSKIGDREVKIASMTSELAAAASFEKSAEEARQALETKEKEMEEMNMELARLQTEVTIARAELDGAYGSRAQRAAEVAANPAIQKEIDDLSKKNTSLAAEIADLKSKGTANPETDEKMRTLKKELEETIEEYEQMTKASIEWEKERESLEQTIDKLRDERERLDAELSDEKVRWMGMKSPGAGEMGPAAGNTSTTVLKNEFKKMMRDTRSENAKALRAEQAERRKVEDELRSIKRAQGPGKSGLSQSSSS